MARAVYLQVAYIARFWVIMQVNQPYPLLTRGDAHARGRIGAWFGAVQLSTGGQRLLSFCPAPAC